MAPILKDWVVHNASATLRWDHTNKGLCYNNLPFLYNITWYPLVEGVPQMDVTRVNTTQSGASKFVIVELTPGTVYQVKIVGFSSQSSLQVMSELLLFNLTTEGIRMHALFCVYIVHHVWMCILIACNCPFCIVYSMCLLFCMSHCVLMGTSAQLDTVQLKYIVFIPIIVLKVSYHVARYSGNCTGMVHGFQYDTLYVNFALCDDLHMV